VNLKARVSKKLQGHKSKEILKLVRVSYKNILQDEMVVLSRSENERLFKQVTTDLFEALINER